ncbi:MAG: YicC family protein [Lentisphaerae bacterium]|nr:YicC family protein [Lentisphaerota bacterium]
MLLSMTGFGKGESVCADGTRVTVQISSVNRKQLEVRFSMPQDLAAMEINGRKLISAAISRGSVQVRCALNTSSRQSAHWEVDSALLDKLIRECHAARSRANMAPEVAVETLLTIPGVVTQPVQEDDQTELTVAFETALRNALEDFMRMRSIEGETLKKDLLSRLEKLEQWHKELSDMTSGYPELAKQRIMSRLAEEKLPVTADDPALLKEVLFYVDKGDVTEELTRLSSHFQQFRAFLDAGEAVGRNMDFLAQEIFREITTLGNKAAVAGASVLVVAFKAEMEKIREQIQNIE